jgi:CHAT domain-containing protein
VRELTVVPDDCLHGFPFAALPLEGGYLVERYAVSLAYQCLPRRAPRPARSGFHRSREALLAGVDESPGDLPALPDGARQLRWVGRLLVRRGLVVSSLRNGQVRKEELLAKLPRVAIWHMSCHGVFHPDRPEATGLMLLPRESHEQLVSLRELSTLRLNHLRQVVLASCWAADNYLLPGRWVISLPEVLWRAGADSVLACLWEVEDRAVGRLSRDFYVALGRLSRVRALRLAQLRMLHRRETAHPIFWAGYQLYGDTGRLR